MIFGAIELKTKCEKCGQPVILNGPALNALCNSCQTEIELDPRSWHSILGDLPADLRELKEGEGQNSQIWGSVNVEFQKFRVHPICSSCKNRFQNAETLVTEGKTDWKCEQCGTITPGSPPPKWLAWSMPEIAFLIGAEQAAVDGKPEQTEVKPIIFTCPSCGGSLKVGGGDRMIQCEFCQSEIYLPDDLWLRLHPAKKVRPWYLAISDPADDPDLPKRLLNRDLLIAAYEDDDDAGAKAIKQGADPRSADHEDRSALFYASATDCRKLVRILLREEADVNKPDAWGTSPLNIAAYNGNEQVVGYLLEAGAEVNSRNHVGVTALNGAAKNGHLEIVRMLLEAGADPSIPNEDGVTPAQRARENGHTEVAELIEKAK